jgi:hypothetical protein
MPTNNTIHVINFTPKKWRTQRPLGRYIITMTGKRIITMTNKQILTNGGN